jgi:hypothetical protein
MYREVGRNLVNKTLLRFFDLTTCDCEGASAICDKDWGGENTNPASSALTSRSARSPLWKPTLSRVTTSPFDRVGASGVSI